MEDERLNEEASLNNNLDPATYRTDIVLAEKSSTKRKEGQKQAKRPDKK